MGSSDRKGRGADLTGRIRAARRSAPGSRGRPRASLLLLALLGLRALVLLFAVELSGLSHAALDVVCSLTGCAHEEGDCDEGEGGHECPPGCPSCHCWHAGAPTAPLRMQPGRRIVVALGAQQGFVPGVAMPPAGADPDSIYRPPRAALHS